MAVTPAAELYHLSCEFIIVQTTAAAVFHGLVTAVMPSESHPYGSNLVDCCCCPYTAVCLLSLPCCFYPLLLLSLHCCMLASIAVGVPARLHACVGCCLLTSSCRYKVAELLPDGHVASVGVWRRYSEFAALNAQLANLAPPNFPGKKTFGNNSPDHIEGRR